MTTPPFRYRQLAWLVSAALAGSGSAIAAPAGNVDFAIGGVTVTGTDGKVRPAARGQELQSGDRIVTTNGRAQIRFTDGAFVSLQPNTDFAIRDYRYEGKTDGSERGVFGLLRGALRTVTGAIGRVNRGAYQIQTPTATIGIRGTGGLIQVQDDGTTRVRGFSGIWTLANKGGTLAVAARQAAVATPKTDEAPTETTEGPLVPAPPPGPLEIALLPRPQDNGLPPSTGTNSFVAGDAVNGNGIPLAIAEGSPPITSVTSTPTPPSLSCSTGCELAYGTLQMPSVVTVGSVSAVSATAPTPPTLSGGNLVGFTDLGGVPYALTGTNVDTGQADGVVSWGRWTGSATLSGAPWSGFVSLPYVVGLPSPIADLTATTGTFTFNLIGSTAPTNGALTGTVTGGTLVGHFGANPMVDIVNFSLSVGPNSYVINQPSIPVPIGGPFAPFAASSIPVTGSCATGCLADVKGHFMGAGATHAGFAYKVNNPFDSLNPDTVGAAAFKR